ncbi:MAG: hypothetical protein IJ679_11500, partial [Lachnospiraceae bacterium]|nr:hypothetical protein [Lachnospiraceae bacterium]
RVWLVWTSGLDTNRSRTLMNEVLTEYLTKCIMEERYESGVDARNVYLPLLSTVNELEKRVGRTAIVRAYLDGDSRFFERKWKGYTSSTTN